MKNPLSIAICIALLGLGQSALAVTDSDVNSVIPFNLASPGARSLGMGGAFLGLADDATAAFTNPAGLTQLPEIEVSIEGRHTSYSVPFLDGGSSASIDSFNSSGFRSADANSSTNNLSFFSFVYPHDRLVFALYRHEVLHYDNSFIPNLKPSTIDFGSLGTLDIFPATNKQSLKVVDYGISGAWRVNDAVSLGVGLSYYEFNIDSSVDRVSDSTYFTEPGVVLNQQFQNGSDNDVGINLGALFKLTDQWSIALAYRQGPRFDYRANATVFAVPLANADGTFSTVPITPPVAVSDLSKVGFKIPDVYAAGLSWHPNDAWRVNFDFDQVMYSQVTDHMQSVFGYTSQSLTRLVIPDGKEFHLGAEYTFTQMGHPISVRAGVWRDPRHSIEYHGNPATDPDLANNPSVAALALIFGVTQGGQTHGAIGAGMAFKQFQIDFGADFSDLADTYSLSAVWRF
jgi:long-chain fatty acid transport protein